MSDESTPNATAYELVMYSRTYGCPYVTIAKRVLQDYDIPYREIFIDLDAHAKERVLTWTGFLSVPTLIIAEQGKNVPYTDFDDLPQGASPNGIDRGPMITEARANQLEAWLRKNNFISSVSDSVN